jgi:hypothetical protein
MDRLCLANNCKGYWHIAGDSLNRVLANVYWANPGLMSLANRYYKIRNALWTNVYRIVRTVVWGDGRWTNRLPPTRLKCI